MLHGPGEPRGEFRGCRRRGETSWNAFRGMLHGPGEPRGEFRGCRRRGETSWNTIRGMLHGPDEPRGGIPRLPAAWWNTVDHFPRHVARPGCDSTGDSAADGGVVEPAGTRFAHRCTGRLGLPRAGATAESDRGDRWRLSRRGADGEA